MKFTPYWLDTWMNGPARAASPAAVNAPFVVGGTGVFGDVDEVEQEGVRRRVPGDAGVLPRGTGIPSAAGQLVTRKVASLRPVALVIGSSRSW